MLLLAIGRRGAGAGAGGCGGGDDVVVVIGSGASIVTGAVAFGSDAVAFRSVDGGLTAAAGSGSAFEATTGLTALLRDKSVASAAVAIAAAGLSG